MRHRDVVGYEADSQPVETVRGEFEAKDRCGPIRQGARDAVRRWPQGRSFRSSVIVVERLDVAGATQAADWGLRALPTFDNCRSTCALSTPRRPTRRRSAPLAPSSSRDRRRRRRARRKHSGFAR